MLGRGVIVVMGRILITVNVSEVPNPSLTLRFKTRDRSILSLIFALANCFRSGMYKNKTRHLIVDRHTDGVFIPKHIDQSRAGAALEIDGGLAEIGGESGRGDGRYIFYKSDLRNQALVAP